MDLREYLCKKRLTQVAFAKAIDFNIVYLRDVLSGRRNPGKRLRKAIIEASNGEVTEQDLKEAFKKGKKNEQMDI